MKKLLLIYLTTTALFSLTAQNTNSAKHVPYSIVPSNMISIHSKSYYMECTGISSVAGIDNNGQSLFNTPILATGGNHIAFKLVRTNDDKLLTITHLVGGCDYFDTPETVITRCDTLGVIDYSVSLQRQIRDIIQHPDGSYYLVHAYDPNFAGPTIGQNILHYSALGVALSPVTNSFTAIYSILALPNGNLLINGKENGVTKIVEMNTSGAIINTTNYSPQINSFKLSNGVLYALTANGSIQSYSTNLTPLNNSSPAMLPNIRITDFNLRNDSLFCTGYDTINKYPYYGLLGNNLNPLYQTLAPYKNTFPTGISITNFNRVNIVTYGNSNTNTKMKYAGLYQTSTTGSLVSKYNAGVIGYNVLSSNFLGMSFIYFSNLANVQLAVQVQNFGTDTINDFYLNYEGAFDCGLSYHQKFNVRLNPNSVITVTTNPFNVVLPVSSYVPPFTSVKYQGNVCISSSVPNSENDIATDNDSWCSELSFEPVGMNELKQVDNTIRLFPNPAQNYFNIEAENNITTVEVTNITGALIYSELADKQNLKIDTDTWAKGIYFVKLQTEKGSSVKKVVKD